MAKLIIKNKYGVIPNDILNNSQISLKAKGLFAYLQSKPDGWRFSKERIALQTKDGKEGIKSALQELEKWGYLKRIPSKDRKGRWTGYDYVLIAENPSTENPSTENPSTENGVAFSNKDGSKIDIVRKKKEGESKDSHSDNKVSLLRNYFVEQCKKLKGFEPEMSFAKEGHLLKQRLKRYSVEQLKDLIDKFMRSKIGEDLGYTLSICLSANTINKWLAGKLAKPKRPTYNGSPMYKKFGKWYVLEKGEWLEYNDSEDKIVYI